MVNYECEYCKTVLCPEVCDEAKEAHNKWINSEEFKKLQESRESWEVVL